MKRLFLLASLYCFCLPLWADDCLNSSNFQALTAQSQFRQALRELDQCMHSLNRISEADDKVFKQLSSIVLEDKATGFDAMYNNFKTVMALRVFDNLAFRFLNFFETRPSTQHNLFADIHANDKTFYFYHDTGRLRANQRGIALTKDALFWRNISGKTQKMSFKQINNMAIVYSPGLSFTPWKLLLNNNKQLDIRLSQIPNRGVLSYVSALIYFIEMNRDRKKSIYLYISDKAKKYLE